MASDVARTVAVLVWVAASACAIGSETEFGNDRPTMLVENIKRKLMNENYDYMPSESEEMFPIKHELSKEDTTVISPPSGRDADGGGGRVNRANDLDSDLNEHYISRKGLFNDDLDSFINNNYIPGARDIKPTDDFENDNSHAISRKDLLYYINDDRLRYEAAEKAVDEIAEDTTVVDTTSPKVKYKVLKVKQPHRNRRSQTYRRFIQEEGENGVAIINLDDEPFPEFRLPRSRRQYMMDQHDLDSELEIAPPLEIEEGFIETENVNITETVPIN